MPRRQSISNGYQIPPGPRRIPPTYQPEPISMITGSGKQFQPIPMAPQYKTPSVVYNNSLKHNRVAPPPQPSMDYNTYSQPNHSFRSPSSMMLSNPPLQISKRQPPMDTIYPNQPYYQQNNHLGVHPDDDDDLGRNSKPTPWSSKPLCLGLTRLSGGVLFGTMIILSLASIGGLITSIALYVTDITTDPQWKILGMVVCAIMLLTVLVTLSIFIYCYKKGHIINNNNNNNMNNYNNNNSLTPSYNQENDLRNPYNYNRSPLPYEMNRNVSSLSENNDVIEVQDKQTNTETTISPLRPRDFQRGVWQANNAYGGISYRPLEPPKMVHRFTQAFSNEIDQTIANQRNPMMPNQRNQIDPMISNQRNYIDPVTSNQRNYIDPVTSHQRNYIDPMTSNQRNFIDPGTSNQRNYIDPMTSNQRNQIVDIAPKTIVRLPTNHRDKDGQKRSRRFIEPQPQYEIVEEMIKKPRKRRQSDEYVEIVDIPKKGKTKQRFNKVSVKHVKTIEQPDSIEDDFTTDHFYQ